MAAARLAPDKSVSAVVLRKMLVAGSKMLEVNKESVNALNVFPVPDGDTGTNMSLTMISAMKEVCKNTTNTMEALCQDLTKGALRGARGNSGVILSQILKGFANVVSPQEELDIKNFARALKSGVELAYSAVAKPKEGTMLTVIRVMTEHALEISKKPLTYDNFLSALIEKGEEILAQTPEMLDVLKKAGVVDSGGYGIIMIFKGIPQRGNRGRRRLCAHTRFPESCVRLQQAGRGYSNRLRKSRRYRVCLLHRVFYNKP